MYATDTRGLDRGGWSEPEIEIWKLSVNMWILIDALGVDELTQESEEWEEKSIEKRNFRHTNI